MSKFVDPIPDEFQPTLADNIPLNPAYRGLIKDSICDECFLPTFIQNKNEGKSFVSKNKSSYSLSLSNSYDSLIKTISASVRLQNSIVAIARGCTNIDRGIAEAPNKKGHVNYFVFDSKNNNPSNDFVKVETLRGKEK